MTASPAAARPGTTDSSPAGSKDVAQTAPSSPQRRLRRPLRRLEQDGVAREHRGKGVAERDQERHVPRRDQADDAARHAPLVSSFIEQGPRPARGPVAEDPGAAAVIQSTSRPAVTSSIRSTSTSGLPVSSWTTARISSRRATSAFHSARKILTRCSTVLRHQMSLRGGRERPSRRSRRAWPRQRQGRACSLFALEQAAELAPDRRGVQCFHRGTFSNGMSRIGQLFAPLSR